MKTLIEALMDLDPENQNHWTNEGLPKLDALKFATGNPSLTRTDVTDAAPLFTRENRVVEEPAPVEEVRSADPELRETIQQEQEQKHETIVASLEVKITLAEALRNILEPQKVGDVTSLSDEEIAARLALLGNVVIETQEAKAMLDKSIQVTQADMDKLIIEQESRRPKSNMTATQMYLEAQKKRTPEDMISDRSYQNPIDDPVARMVARSHNMRSMGR